MNKKKGKKASELHLRKAFFLQIKMNEKTKRRKECLHPAKNFFRFFTPVNKTDGLL